MTLLKYILPLIFIAIGLWILLGKDPHLTKSRKLAILLLVLGALTLIARVVLDYFV